MDEDRGNGKFEEAVARPGESPVASAPQERDGCYAPYDRGGQQLNIPVTQRVSLYICCINIEFSHTLAGQY